MKKVFFKSESFSICPGDIMDILKSTHNKVNLIDDIIEDCTYIINKTGCENDFLITKYDNILGCFCDSDIFSYDILYSMILQFLTDDNYTFFD